MNDLEEVLKSIREHDKVSKFINLIFTIFSKLQSSPVL